MSTESTATTVGVASSVPAVVATVKRGRGRPKCMTCKTEGLVLSIKESKTHMKANPTHTVEKMVKTVAPTA